MRALGAGTTCTRVTNLATKGLKLTPDKVLSMFHPDYINGNILLMLLEELPGNSDHEKYVKINELVQQQPGNRPVVQPHTFRKRKSAATAAKRAENAARQDAAADHEAAVHRAITAHHAANFNHAAAFNHAATVNQAADLMHHHHHHFTPPSTFGEHERVATANNGFTAIKLEPSEVVNFHAIQSIQPMQSMQSMQPAQSANFLSHRRHLDYSSYLVPQPGIMETYINSLGQNQANRLMRRHFHVDLNNHLRRESGTDEPYMATGTRAVGASEMSEDDSLTGCSANGEEASSVVGEEDEDASSCDDNDKGTPMSHGALEKNLLEALDKP